MSDLENPKEEEVRSPVDIIVPMKKKRMVLKEWVKWLFGLIGLSATMTLSQAIVNLTVPGNGDCVCSCYTAPSS